MFGMLTRDDLADLATKEHIDDFRNEVYEMFRLLPSNDQKIDLMRAEIQAMKERMVFLHEEMGSRLNFLQDEFATLAASITRVDGAVRNRKARLAELTHLIDLMSEYFSMIVAAVKSGKIAEYQMIPTPQLAKKIRKDVECKAKETKPTKKRAASSKVRTSSKV